MVFQEFFKYIQVKARSINAGGISTEKEHG